MGSAERPSQVTICVLPASASPLALVIRRGPSKWWHFLLWDRDTGIVTPGSWFHGLVFPERCDLSPKGDWMALLAYRGGPNPLAWTALCHPPSVSALVFWPQEHAKMGGGFFDDRLNILWLNFSEGMTTPEIREKTPWEIGLQETDKPVLFGTIEERMKRDGWKVVKGEGVQPRWRKSAPNRSGELEAEFLGRAAEYQLDHSLFFEPGRVIYRYRATATTDWITLEGVTWAGFNGRGQVAAVAGSRLQVGIFRESSGIEWRQVMELAGLRPRISTRPTPRTQSTPEPTK
jgi:hypothetical protein